MESLLGKDKLSKQRECGEGDASGSEPGWACIYVSCIIQLLFEDSVADGCICASEGQNKQRESEEENKKE